MCEDVMDVGRELLNCRLRSGGVAVLIVLFLPHCRLTTRWHDSLRLTQYLQAETGRRKPVERTTDYGPPELKVRTRWRVTER
ncbi:hypothetical protein M404DRAFT_630112 [Pisolithus tinctorius Marx 270]|uniref:Uncharacterized protein n=1 Tax=Pisolithus tinctorius Marx 270 TaxID=870435 RepID=A0A0C3NQ58_PISTI|nr:hypothetical protein M404DRAFT_630112 [Pisolithus tinctorius Marx 270]